MNIQLNKNLLHNISNELLYKSRDTFIDKIVSNLYDSRFKHNDFSKFKNKLTNTYNDKSNNLFTYYIKNHTKQYNMQTNHLKQYLNKNNEYIYKNNIRFDSDGNYTIVENKKGAYLDNQFRKSGLKNFAKTKHLQYINKNKKELFLTLTLPSSYHYFKKGKNDKLIKNKQCRYDNIEDALDNGYIHLNNIYRQLYKNIKRTLQRKNLNTNFDYIFIFEPHKSGQLHIHTLFWIDIEQIDIFYKEYNNVKKSYRLKQTKLKYINTKKYVNNSKLKKKTKVSSYIYKYLIKSYKANEVNEYSRYKSYFKNKSFFRTSQYKDNITQAKIDFIYKYLYNNDNKLLTKMKKKLKPLYTQIIELINNKTFIFEYDIVKTTIAEFNHIKESLLINTKTNYIYNNSQIKKELAELKNEYENITYMLKYENSNKKFKVKNINDLSKLEKEYYLRAKLKQKRLYYANRTKIIKNYQDNYKYFVKSYLNEYIESNLDYIIQDKNTKQLQTITYTKNNIKCIAYNINETITYESISQNKYEMFENFLGINNNELYKNNDILEQYSKTFNKPIL